MVRLIDQFPHAEIVYNPQKIGTPIRFPDFLKDIDFKAPFENLIKPFEKFKMNSKAKVDIEMASGTKIGIQPNSFKTNNNRAHSLAIDHKTRVMEL